MFFVESEKKIMGGQGRRGLYREEGGHHPLQSVLLREAASQGLHLLPLILGVFLSQEL